MKYLFGILLLFGLLKPIQVFDISLKRLSFGQVPATFWTIANILKDLNVQKEILQEIEETLKGKSESEYVSAMKEMVKLDSAIMESLRITSNSLSIRQVEQETTIEISNDKSYSFFIGSILIYMSSQ